MYAAAFPARPAACIALAPHVVVEAVTLAGIRAAEADPGAPETRRRLARYHGAQTEALWRAWTETWLRPGFEGCNLRAELPSIVCPTLVVQGEDDAYGSAAQVELIAAGARGRWRPACCPPVATSRIWNSVPRCSPQRALSSSPRADGACVPAPAKPGFSGGSRHQNVMDKSLAKSILAPIFPL